MFGGGAKKEKKDDDEDRGDNSGSAKAQRDAAAAKKEGDDVSLAVPCRQRASPCPYTPEGHYANPLSAAGGGARVRGRPLRARHPPDGEG